MKDLERRLRALEAGPNAADCLECEMRQSELGSGGKDCPHPVPCQYRGKPLHWFIERLDEVEHGKH